jgi:hypothetical protein
VSPCGFKKRAAFEDRTLIGAFYKFIRDCAFPCVGAKAALARNGMKTVRAADIRSNWNDFGIVERLLDFADSHKEEVSL